MMQMECDDDDPPAEGEKTILGRSQEGSFVPIEEGAVFTLLRGLQGGQHIDASVRFFAEEGDTWEHKFNIYDPETNEQIGGRLARVRTCTPGWSELRTIVFVFNATSTPGLFEVVTSRLDEQGQPVRSLTAQVPIEIVWEEP